MDSQRWRPEEYARSASFVPELGRPVVELLAPQPGERILDLGCGPGDLTRTLLAAGATVVGVDRSEAMVSAAQRAGIDARVADGIDLPFHQEFDAVFSNAALHWMKSDPDAVLRGVRRALRGGGRFVAELGGLGNVRRLHSALEEELKDRGLDPATVDPWYFPSPEEYRARLEFAGFRVDRMELFPRPTALPDGIESWLSVFAGPFFDALPADERPSARASVVERLRPVARDAQGTWVADYVRLRFRAYAGEAP